MVTTVFEGEAPLAGELQAIAMPVPVELVRPNPSQPRREFDQKTLQELADSLKEHGLIQPITVEPVYPANGDTELSYILHDGERRLRAAKLAGLAQIPAYIVEPGADAQQLLIRAVVANLQRTDLNPIELARAYQELANQGLSDNEIAKQVGKSRSTVTNTRRLLNLPADRQQQVAAGNLSERQAMAILPYYQLPPKLQSKIADNWSFHEVDKNPAKFNSDQIREKLRRSLADFSSEIKPFSPDEELTGQDILHATCTGCPYYLKVLSQEPRCMDSKCNQAKRNIWERRQLEQARAVTGCDFVDPGLNLPWGKYTGLDYNEQVREYALANHCPNLRLRYNSYPTQTWPEGVSNHIGLICLHPNGKKGDQACACAQSFKADEIAAQKAKDQQFAVMKQQVAEALATAITNQQPAGFKAIALQLASSGKKFKSDDPAYLIQQIANMLAERNCYFYSNYTSLEEYQTRIDEYLAKLGLSLNGSANPVADLDARLLRLGEWVKSLRSALPTPEQVAGNLANLAELVNEVQQLQDTGSDQDRTQLAEAKIFAGIDQLKTALLTLQPLFPDQAGYIEIAHVSWLLTVPAGDVNFKSHLKQIAYPETIDYALALADLFQTSKTALKAIEIRRRKLEPVGVQTSRERPNESNH